MGKGKPRWDRRREQEPEDAGSDSEISVEEGDIEALARSTLNAGETILGEGQKADQVESRGVCHAPLILQKKEDIEYKVPAGAKRVPWIDTMCIDGWKEIPKDIKAKDGVKLEQAFMDMAGEAVKEAYRRLRVMKVPSSRPSDFYAEMMRSDSQMFKVRERAAEEQRRIKIVEQRKQNQANKKFAKAAKVKKSQDQAGEKRKTLDEIASWKNRSKEDKRNTDDRDLEDILDGQKKRKRADDDEEDDKDKKKKAKGPNKKRMAIDKKWGHGGKKKWKKSNDAASTNDMTASPWGKKAKKGKGKGKGGGGGKRFRN